MTWVVELPEGSRPGKHEIKVPEGKVITDHQLVKFLENWNLSIHLSCIIFIQGERIARYWAHPLHTVRKFTKSKRYLKDIFIHTYSYL